MLLHEKEKSETLAWFVYLLSCADKTLYCGITKDIKQRIEMHNGNIKGGAKYTRGRRPVELVAYIQVATQRDALLLEISIKKKPRAQKIPFVQSLSNAMVLNISD